MDVALAEVLTPASAGGTTDVTTDVNGAAITFQPNTAIIFGVRTSGTQGLASAFRIGMDSSSGGGKGRALNPGLFSGSHVADGYGSGDGYSFVAMRTQGLNELMVLGYVQTWLSNGIRIKWDWILVATGVRFYIALIGGGTFASQSLLMNPNTNPYSVTSLAWQPKGLFGFSTHANTVLLPGADQIGFGFSGGTVCGQCSLTGTYSSFPAGSVINSKGYQRSGQWLTLINGSTGAITNQQAVTSLNANGFTVSNTGGGVNAVLAVKGCALNVGVFNEPLLAGAQSVPILASSGKLVFLFSFGKTSNAAAVDDHYLSFGAAAGSAQKSVWAGERDGSFDGSTSERSDCNENGNFIGAMRLPTGNATSTLLSQVTFSSLGNGQLNLNWGQVDGSGREWGYAVFAEEIPGQDCGGAAPVIGAGIYEIIIDKTHDTLYNPFPATTNVKIP